MRSNSPTPPDLSNIQERSSAELGEIAESLRNFRQGMQSELIGRALRGDKEAEQVLETHSFGSKALYTGTFDPFTNGHLDVALRAASLFDELTIAVGVNPAKTPLFQPQERVEMIQKTVKDYPNIRVISYQDGSAHRAELEGCNIIIRGVRNDRLGQVFCDLDLAILSAPRSRYAEYAAGIASEYAPTVGAEAYNKGRIDFLEETLKRDTFFYSPEEFGLSNIRARQNMAAEKEKLEAIIA